MKNNENESKKGKLYHYQVADKVSVKGDRSSKFGDYACKGHYEIVQVNNNGTVKIPQVGSWQRQGKILGSNPRQGQLKVESVAVHPVIGPCRGDEAGC
eukprot:13726156-Ditylum_brightwellii.AAC.1